MILISTLFFHHSEPTDIQLTNLTVGLTSSYNSVSVEYYSVLPGYNITEIPLKPSDRLLYLYKNYL